MKEKLIVTESWSTKKKFFVVISFVSLVFLLTWTFYYSIHEYQKQKISNLQDKIYLLNEEISTLNNKLENSNNINNKLEDSIKLINKNFEKFKQAILVDQMEKRICRNLKLILIDFKMNSRAATLKEQIIASKEFLDWAMLDQDGTNQD